MSELNDRIYMKDFAARQAKMRTGRRNDAPRLRYPLIFALMGFALVVLLADRYFGHREVSATDRAAYTCRVDRIDGVRIESCIRMLAE